MERDTLAMVGDMVNALQVRDELVVVVYSFCAYDVWLCVLKKEKCAAGRGGACEHFGRARDGAVVVGLF